jgi:hypothetical protein
MDPITGRPPRLGEEKTVVKDYFSCRTRTEVENEYDR